MKLPMISGTDVVKTLSKIGFHVKHRKGSHIILRRDEPSFAQLTVPEHEELDRGTLRAIVRQAGLTVEQFMELL